MAKEKFNTIQRTAIWRAHKKRCIYCAELIPFNNLHIDHILPESLLTNVENLNSLKNEYDLPADFEIDNYINLVPAHNYCNLKKAAKIFSKNAALHFLLISKAKVQQVEKIEKELKVNADREKILIDLQLAIEIGVLSFQQVHRVLKELEKKEYAFKLIQEIVFSDKVIEEYLRKAEVKDLLNLPILPRKFGLDYLKMVNSPSNNKDDIIHVKTCNEWADARRKGYLPSTNYDTKEEALFEKIYSLLTAINRANVADKSYIDSPRIGLNDINLLPLSLLPILSRDEEEEIRNLEAKNISLSDLVTSGEVNIGDFSKYSLSLTYKGIRISFWEMIRADLNGNGLQDLLVNTYQATLQGALSYGNTIVLTRKDPETRLELLTDIQLKP